MIPKYDLQSFPLPSINEMSYMLGSGKDRKAVHCSTVDCGENCGLCLTKFIPTLARNQPCTKTEAEQN